MIKNCCNISFFMCIAVIFLVEQIYTIELNDLHQRIWIITVSSF